MRICPKSVAAGMQRGFTLIELLVAGAVGALAVAALLAAFAGSLRVWDRAAGASSALQDAAVALEWLQRDLHNAIASRQARFEGGADQLQFPACTGGESEDSPVGIVTYGVAPASRQLQREWLRLPRVTGGAPSVEVAAAGIESIRFSYRSGPEGAWVTTWNDPTGRPATVRMTLRFAPERGGIEIQRTVAIPES